MEGFFSKKQTESKSRPDGKVYSCASCGLYKHADTPRMKPSGGFKKGILNIGEFPNDLDDERGRQWQGKEGRLLKRVYGEVGIDLFEDCLNLNAVNCYSNGHPTTYEIDCCRSVIVEKVLQEYKPVVIVLLGTAAVESFLGHRWKKDMKDINLWRGWMIPDQEYKAWVLPVFSPRDVVDKDTQVLTIFKNDVKRIKDAVESTFTPAPVPNINYIEKLDHLRDIKAGAIAFDYETTGLKPHATGHRIICASVATEDQVYAFLMPKTKREREPFVNLLINPAISKMAHNIKFEDHWTFYRLRCQVENWGWDSMLAAHLLDNRPGITSLKFQTYINFGIIDYASEVTYYLQSGKNDGNAINRIEEIFTKQGGKEMLLKYCALDSFYEYHLAMRQIKEIGYSFLPF